MNKFSLKNKSSLLILGIFLISSLAGYIVVTQYYLDIFSIPFRIATCPYGNGTDKVDIYDIPMPIAMPGQGSDHSVKIVLRSWWGQYKGDVTTFENEVWGDEAQTCANANILPRGSTFRTILPPWVTAPIENYPHAFIINTKGQALVTTVPGDSDPRFTWLASGDNNHSSGGTDPQTFITQKIQRDLPVNILKSQKATTYDITRDDGSIDRSDYFVVLVEEKAENSVLSRLWYLDSERTGTYSWRSLDSLSTVHFLNAEEILKTANTMIQ